MIGTIAEFVSQAGFYALVRTEYEAGVIYVRALSLYLMLKDNFLYLTDVDDTTMVLGTVNLADPDSLDRLLELLKKHDQGSRY